MWIDYGHPRPFPQLNRNERLVIMEPSRIHLPGLTPRDWHRALGLLLPIVVALSQIEPATSQAPNRTNATVDGHHNDDNVFPTILSPILSTVTFVALIIVCGGYLKVLGCCHSGWLAERNPRPIHPPDAPLLPSQLTLAVMPHVTPTALGAMMNQLDTHPTLQAMIRYFVTDYITSDPPATDPITLRPVAELLGDPTVNRHHLIVYVSGPLHGDHTRLRVLYLEPNQAMPRLCPSNRDPITHAMTWP
ncbi:hypothetical protein EBZ35_09060, partial [bacterium]|nr:hypothetical protein [bacterium]